MPDLTFLEVELVRNVLGKTASSETWLDGEVVSKAEVTRKRLPNVQISQAEAVAQAAKARGAEGYDAAHWYYQPVGGRQQEVRPKQPVDKNTRGALSSKSNESNVDIVVFGHEQDGVGVDAGEHWEMDQKDWLGFKKRVGGMDANNAVVDAVVFGHDQDGFTSMKKLEEEMMTLPQFRGAAGVCSSEVTSSNIMQDAKIVPSKFTKLKNSSDVDMVVFGHDQDGSGEGPNQDMEDLEASPLFFGSAGVHTTDASLKEAAMWYGGPKGRSTTPLQHSASSTDQSFQVMQDGPGTPQARFKGSRPFNNAAGNVGTPSALPANSDGTIAWASRKVNRPTDTMQDDFAASYLDFRTERGAGANDLPILSQEHGHGSIKAVVFAGPDPKGNREALGVGKITPDSSLLEKREASRRAAVAHGCRSQAYQNESEFSGAAGLGSDEIFFANTADLVRRVKPVSRKAGYSGVTDVDMVVFGHDLEGGDKDGSSMLKEAIFAGSAGASSAQVHAMMSCSRSAPKDVPQMRDQMDNVVFGHEMQDAEQQIKAEQLFFDLQRDSAGEASVEIGSRSFDSRLEKSSAAGGPEFAWGTLGNRHGEPRGDLTSSLPNDTAGSDYPPPYQGSIGAPRDMLARKEMEANYTVNSNGGNVKVRYRNDLDSKDARSVLEENYHPEKNTSYGSLKASVHVTPDEKIEGAAGKASRMINDYNAGPFTWVDVDTEEERRLAEFNAGSQAVQEVLEGDGYLLRDTDPKAKLIPDEYAAVKGRKVDAATAALYKKQKELVMGDSVAKLNILQPDLNFAMIDKDGDGVIEADEIEAAGGLQGDVWQDEKSEIEILMAQKNFGQPKPFGTDPLDSWYGKPDYTTSKKADVDKHQATHAAAIEHHRTYVPPSLTPGGIRKSAFEPAWHVSEADGKKRQYKVHPGIHKTAPFGVDEPDFNLKYETSTLAGPGSWDQSMASRIARRRLTGRQPKSPTATGSKDDAAIEAGLAKLRANVGNM
uniref:EF-hand domain-containing protein n=1 Tax=Haptolina brevifila TaxID=156173 RepID=A0A7S2MS22_9EUKA